MQNKIIFIAVLSFIVYIALVAGVLGFIGWVIIKLLQHFAII